MTLSTKNPEFPIRKRKSRKLFLGLALFTSVTMVHFLLLLQLGSLIAGTSMPDVPQTTKASLVVLMVTFLSMKLSIPFLLGSVTQDIHAKSTAFFLITVPIVLIIVLAFRIPYSTIFLFWGFLLQYLVWQLIVFAIERKTKPIVGLTSDSASDLKDLIRAERVHIISPDIEERLEVDYVVLKEREITSSEWSDFLTHCSTHSIMVEEYANLMERLSGRIDLDNFSFRNSLQLIRKNRYLTFKRIIDWVVSLVLLLTVTPFMALIFVVISLESKGSPIFSQQRVGFGGKPFTIYKFRTMKYVDDDAPVRFASKTDTRVTMIGHFLRKTRIDELPQLWNVLIGEMSLIGPRPEQLGLINSIEAEIPLFSLRHSVRPGITGWAQVKQGYAYDIQTTRKKLSYDLWYVSNCSLLVDLSIAVLTLKVVSTGFGSR